MVKRKEAQPARSAKTDAPTLQIFVRRGALRRFDILKRRSAELPVNVLWDRRTDERRSASVPREESRRQAERRQTDMPFTWALADFVVARAGTPRRKTAGSPKPAAVARKRSKSSRTS